MVNYYKSHICSSDAIVSMNEDEGVNAIIFYEHEWENSSVTIFYVLDYWNNIWDYIIRSNGGIGINEEVNEFIDTLNNIYNRGDIDRYPECILVELTYDNFDNNSLE